MVRYILVIMLMASVIGCSDNSSQSPRINFSGDSSKIVVSNIGEAELFELKKMIPDTVPCGDILCVMETLSENDSTGREQELPGMIHFQGDTLYFEPNDNFKKGRQYLVETIIGSNFATVKDALGGNLGHTVKSKSATLKR